MLALLKLLPFMNKLMEFIDKIYDEYTRSKYKKLGKAELNAEVKSQMSADQMVRKEISAKVDKDSEDEVNAGLVDPRK
jgi:hypothetical protein